MEGFHHDAHPMGMLVSTVAALSTFYPEAKDIEDPDVADEADRPADRQDADPGRRRLPPLGRHAVRLPGQQPRLRRQLPVDDVEDRRAPLRRQPGAVPGARRAVHPPRRPRAELLHHRHAHRGLARTPTRTSPPPPPPRRSTAPATAAPTRPSSRCCNEIGSIDNVEAYVEAVKARRDPPAGLRPPRLQELRPPGPHHQEDRRRRLRGHRQEPAARHRAEARGGRPRATTTSSAASSTRTSTSTRASSTRRWASRWRCSPCCSPSPARAGWLAHYIELLEQESRIYRPRQLYVGHPVRDYTSIETR